MFQVGFNRIQNKQPQKPSKVAFKGMSEPSRETMDYLRRVNPSTVFQVNFQKTFDLFAGIKVFEGIKPKDFFKGLFTFDAILLQMGCIHQCRMCGADSPQRIKTMPFDNFKKVIDGFAEVSDRLGFNPFKTVEKNGNNTLSLYQNSDPMIYGSKDNNGV